MSFLFGPVFVTETIVERAACNNALWCDAVCAARSRGGEFCRDFWLFREGAPPLYPDLITLTGLVGVPPQMAAVAELIQAPRQSGWAIKDSHQTLDLRALGFESFFDAEWLLAPMSPSNPRASDLRWTRVEAEADLERWECAWRLAESLSDYPRLFMPRLLRRTDIAFMIAVADGAFFAGGVVNQGAGVVGLSNVFAQDVDLDAVWTGLTNSARRLFPDRPIVAYDRDESLAAARRAGFVSVGSLRVWRREGLLAR